MKNQKIWKFAALFMAALCMTFTFTACENEEDEESEPKFSDYFTMSITRCERVGSMLILDWTIKNKSKVDAQSLTIDMGSVWCHSTDDTGETYPYGNVSVGGKGSSLDYESRTVAVLAGETIQGTIRINASTMSANATKFTLDVDVACKEMGVSETLEFKNIAITDNRVKSKGIQTNDTYLAYAVKSCGRDDDGNVVLCFTVKNNTGVSLQDYKVSLGNFTDSAGSSCTREISTTGDWQRKEQVYKDLAAGATQTYYIKVNYVSASATWISGGATVVTDNYTFEYNTVSFLNIPIQ